MAIRPPIPDLRLFRTRNNSLMKNIAAINSISSTEDLRISEIREVAPPEIIHNELPITEAAAKTTRDTRSQIHEILIGQDDRLLVIVGPCSIHDPDAAREYADRLLAIRGRLENDLLLVMRVYFEKPRTTVGWKGLINDPELDQSFQINKGLRLARKLLLDLNELGLPDRLMVDFSHANSNKQHEMQMVVGRDISAQLAAGSRRILGVMIESHLVAGNQKVVPGQPLTYG